MVSLAVQREGARVVELQRRRLLSAAVELAFEHGVRELSVGALCARAGVSRRTFYDLFRDRDDCVAAAFEYGAQTAVAAIREATDGVGRDPRVRSGAGGAGRVATMRWRARVRAGLTSLLALFDREPGIARLLVVEALAAGPAILERRQAVLTDAARAVDLGRGEASDAVARGLPALTAEGVVAAVFGVIHARLVATGRDGGGRAGIAGDGAAGAGGNEPLVELMGPLMALIVHPYLGSAAARRELDAKVELDAVATAPRLPADPFKDLPIRLTYRTARVLSSIAQAPDSSSKQVADASGISDQGQVSRLLSRLARNGLIQDNRTDGPARGLPRAWRLTEHGEHILHATGQT